MYSTSKAFSKQQIPVCMSTLVQDVFRFDNAAASLSVPFGRLQSLVHCSAALLVEVSPANNKAELDGFSMSNYIRCVQ